MTREHLPGLAAGAHSQVTTLSLPPRMASLASSIMEVDGRPALPAALMPSETERASIASRVASLEEELTPASRGQIIEVVTALLMSSPQQAMNDQTASAKLRVYAAALDDLPAWALRNAAQKWMRGECDGNVAFAPSPGQLRRIAEAEIARHRAVIERLRRVLNARPLAAYEHENSPEVRQRIATKFGDLAASLEGKVRDSKTRAAQYQDETAKKVRA